MMVAFNCLPLASVSVAVVTTGSLNSVDLIVSRTGSVFATETPELAFAESLPVACFKDSDVEA